MNWDFLRATIYNFGSSLKIVDLIKWGVWCSRISVLYNGSLHTSNRASQRRFTITISILLSMEMLAIHIQKLVDSGAWNPIRVTKDGVGISNLFFADDVLLFCQSCGAVL